jgi:hypothetical protein
MSLYWLLNQLYNPHYLVAQPNNVVCFTTNFVLFVGYYFPCGLNKFSVILNSQNVIEK